MKPKPASDTALVALDDAELVRRARARDDGAFRTIMQRHNRRLYRIVRGILRNDHEAEDLVQEAYVRAFTHLDGFRGDSSLRTWARARPARPVWTVPPRAAGGRRRPALRRGGGPRAGRPSRAPRSASPTQGGGEP